MLPSDADLDVELVAKGGLAELVRVGWDQVESSPLRWGRHIDEVCLHLEAVSRREIRQLVINIPPGTGKSLIVCVFWPVWEWIEEWIDRKFLFGSFDSGLTIRDSRRAKGLVESGWFRARWPHIRVKEERDVPNTATEWHNTRGGWRFATSVGGKATGRHPDTRVIDDPTKPKDAMTDSSALEGALLRAEEWYRGTISSRQADPQTSATVLIMQRLHENDLSGILTREEPDEWVHLRLPMRYEPKFSCQTPIGGDWREDDGELLCPERYDEPSVNKLERAMGTRVAAAQLQQRPTPAGGAIYLENWIRYWGAPGSRFVEPPERGAQIQAWDMSFKGKPVGKKRRSFVVGQAWQRTRGDFFLLGQERGQWELVEQIHAVRRLSRAFPRTHRKLIEDAANGAAVVSALKRTLAGMKLVTTGGGSEARAQGVAPFWESGNVWLPWPGLPGFEWVADFVDRLISFPNATYDDEVDAMSHALDFLGGNAAKSYKDAMDALSKVAR